MTGSDPVGAFVARFTRPGDATGPLAGVTFAAKDIYDVAGHVTGCGNPDWRETHAPAGDDAAMVARLLSAGATLVGKTHTDELAYSLMGVNAHTGTPTNVADPRRVPGGSSSGSVAAVAAGLADIGLGSDTGGSVRLPASFCGVYGLRTTHGVLPLDGAMALAPSFDTVGWFTRDVETMAATADALALPDGSGIDALLLPVDVWDVATGPSIDAMAGALHRLETLVGPARPIRLAEAGLDVWFETFRVCQAAEVWQAHGDWIRAVRPRFGPGVAERFATAERITAAQWAAAADVRRAIADAVRQLIGPSSALVMPTGPGPAPFLSASEDERDAVRRRGLMMLSCAGLAGLPQLSIPAGAVEGGPVGLSLVGASGADRALIRLWDDASNAA